MAFENRTIAPEYVPVINGLKTKCQEIEAILNQFQGRHFSTAHNRLEEVLFWAVKGLSFTAPIVAASVPDAVPIIEAVIEAL